MFLTEIDRKIATLNNVAEWNEEKASTCKNTEDRSRYDANARDCRENVMDLIRMDAVNS